MIIKGLIIFVLVAVSINVVYNLIDTVLYRQHIQKELKTSHELKFVSRECANIGERNFGVLIENVSNFEICRTSDFFTRECDRNLL